MENLLEEVKVLVAEIIPVAKKAVCLNSNFESDLGVADRIAFSVGIIAAIEEKFGISISEALASEIETVDDLLIVVECLKRIKEIERQKEVMIKWKCF